MAPLHLALSAAVCRPFCSAFSALPGPGRFLKDLRKPSLGCTDAPDAWDPLHVDLCVFPSPMMYLGALFGTSMHSEFKLFGIDFFTRPFSRLVSSRLRLHCPFAKYLPCPISPPARPDNVPDGSGGGGGQGNDRGGVAGRRAKWSSVNWKHE